MKVYDCIRERVPVVGRYMERSAVSGSFVRLEEPAEVWHIAPKRGRVAGDWCPIRCSDTEGIVAPGYVERRVPTCPDCIAAVSGPIPERTQ